MSYIKAVILMDRVPNENIYAMIATLLICCLFPIVLWIFFARYRKKKRLSTAVIAGAIGFILPQMVIRIPILQLLSRNERWISFCENNTLIAIAIFAVTAALFETAGRLLVFKGILRKRLSYNTALGAGLGHGGAESIGLVGLTYVNNLIFSVMINTGALPDFDGMPEIRDALIGTPATTFLAAGVERASTVAFHIALSVLLCLFIMRGRAVLGATVCFAIHFIVDFFIPLIIKNGLSIWFTEGIIFIIAIISILLVLRLERLYNVIEVPKDEAETALEQGY